MSEPGRRLATEEIQNEVDDAPIDDAPIDEAPIDREDAWVRWVLSKHAPAVGALLHSRYPVFCAEDVEDVVIIALTRLWKARDRFDAEKASLKTFFFRIADNVARDVLKSGWYRARSREVCLDKMPVAGKGNGQPADAASGTRDDAARCELQRDLRAILDRLPPSYRTIVLADASARGRVASADFLAQELQIPTGAVRVYRHRAMKAIRTALEQAGYEIP